MSLKNLDTGISIKYSLSKDRLFACAVYIALILNILSGIDWSNHQKRKGKCIFFLKQNMKNTRKIGLKTTVRPHQFFWLKIILGKKLDKKKKKYFRSGFGEYRKERLFCLIIDSRGRIRILETDEVLWWILDFLVHVSTCFK